MTGTALLNDRLCAVRAARAAQDPIGTGGTTPRLLAIEMPTPWRENLYNGNPDGTAIEQIWALREAYFERLRARPDSAQRFANGTPGFYGIAPVAESDPATRRALVYTRPGGAFAQYDAAEYVFPAESPAMVEFARAFFEAPHDLARYETFRVSRGAERDFFVCTHGQVDICCAKFGVPLYRQACDAGPGVRAWRITHFGGHRYAPTAWEFPSGYKWAYLDEAAARQVLTREGPASAIRLNVRGWSGVAAHVQLLDRAGLDRFGWRWLDFRRAGEVLERDDDGRRSRVRLTFEGPAGEAGAYEGVVSIGREVEEPGCGPRLGEHPYLAPEWVLDAFIASSTGAIKPAAAPDER